jgi:threonine/homoserine/homoserine lactone efflux protein
MDYSLAVYFLQGIALGLSAAATPGPLQSYLISQTLLGGWRSGIMVAFAPLVSDPLVVFTIVFLLEQLPNSIIQTIGILGGLFALYTAFGIYRQWKKTFTQLDLDGESEIENREGHRLEYYTRSPNNLRTYLGIGAKGVVMNILSPGLYLFWFFITGPILLSALEDSFFSGVSFLFGFYLLMITGLLFIVFVFNFSRRFGPKVTQILTLTSILILVIFAVILIVQGIYRLTLSI